VEAIALGLFLAKLKGLIVMLCGSNLPMFVVVAPPPGDPNRLVVVVARTNGE